MVLFLFFFFNDTATTEIYTLSLHDALPICFYRLRVTPMSSNAVLAATALNRLTYGPTPDELRSEEHTSELQSQSNLVCRLLLEKKKGEAEAEKCAWACEYYAEQAAAMFGDQ